MHKTIEPNRVYSRLEAAQVLNVSLSTVKRLILSGQLRVSQPPDMRRIFITGRYLLDYIGDEVLTHELPVIDRKPIEPKGVYSRAEAAEALNISLSTVKRLIAAGYIPFSQAPGMRRVFITGQALLDFLQDTLVDPENIRFDEEDE